MEETVRKYNLQLEKSWEDFLQRTRLLTSHLSLENPKRQLGNTEQRLEVPNLDLLEEGTVLYEEVFEDADVKLDEVEVETVVVEDLNMKMLEVVENIPVMRINVVLLG